MTNMIDVSDISFSHLFVVTNTILLNDTLVPYLVQAGNATSVILDCPYNINNGSDLLLQWYYGDDGKPSVYEWRPHQEPIVRGALKGRLDLSYKASENPLEARRALRIYKLAPDLSGEYTCVVRSGERSEKKTKNMIIYSPDENLLINWKPNKTEVEVRCTAQGVYPKPDLVLQRDKIAVPKQHSRTWQSGHGVLYDAETVAYFLPNELRDSEHFTCRLRVLKANNYRFDKETNIIFRNSTHNSLESLQSQNPSGGNSAQSISSKLGFCIMISIFVFLRSRPSP